MRLPSEAELASTFRTSRNTVREALALLRVDGLLERKPGFGTVFNERAVEPDPTVVEGPMRFTPDGHSRIEYRNLVLSRVGAPNALARQLGVESASAEVTLFERQTLRDGRPLAFRSCFTTAPVDAFLAIPPDEREIDFWDFLERGLGEPIGEVASSISAVTVDAGSASQLRLAVGSMAILVVNLARLGDGRPVALTFLRVPPEQFHLSYRGVRPRDAGAG